eukprot:11411974-Alexandrium_andersonii.AAC.1
MEEAQQFKRAPGKFLEQRWGTAVACAQAVLAARSEVANDWGDARLKGSSVPFRAVRGLAKNVAGADIHWQQTEFMQRVFGPVEDLRCWGTGR